MKNTHACGGFFFLFSEYCNRDTVRAELNLWGQMIGSLNEPWSNRMMIILFFLVRSNFSRENETSDHPLISCQMWSDIDFSATLTVKIDSIHEFFVVTTLFLFSIFILTQFPRWFRPNEAREWRAHLKCKNDRYYRDLDKNYRKKTHTHTSHKNKIKALNCGHGRDRENVDI